MDWELSKALLISLDCQACSGIPLITPQSESRLLEQSSAPHCGSPGVLKQEQGSPSTALKCRQLTHTQGFVGKNFEKKANKKKIWAENWRLCCENARHERSRWNEWLLALLWNVFNLCCWATTKCSPPNSGADRLALEIHFVWKLHSPYGERVYLNTQAFNAWAHISLLHFWLSNTIFPISFLFLCSAPIPFV